MWNTKLILSRVERIAKIDWKPCKRPWLLISKSGHGTLKQISVWKKKTKNKTTNNIIINIFLCYYSSFVFYFNISFSLRDFKWACFKRWRGKDWDDIKVKLLKFKMYSFDFMQLAKNSKIYLVLNSSNPGNSSRSNSKLVRWMEKKPYLKPEDKKMMMVMTNCKRIKVKCQFCICTIAFAQLHLIFARMNETIL